MSKCPISTHGEACCPRNAWRSAKDDPPQHFVSVLVHMPGEAPLPTVREGYLASDGTWVAGGMKRDPGEVVKWKPMPDGPED